MKIVTIYTLYGRRAGAELCFEKTVQSIFERDNSIEWLVLCNISALEVIKKDLPFASPVYVKWLDNQYKKAFWLEYLSGKLINQLKGDCFWIPSGCNHFPGKWSIPIVSTFHDLGEYHINNKYSMSRMLFRKRICIPRNLKRATRFTAVSEFTRQDMHKFLKLDLERIVVVYNGASPHSNDIPKDSVQIVERLGLKDKCYFFTPGRTDYIGKGLDVLLEAFRKFASECPNRFLVLVGPQGEGCQRLIHDIEDGLYKDQIRYLGRVDNDTLVSLYNHSLATVIASRFEGFGFPVLEAMRYKTPIICSNAGSLEEVAGDAAVIFNSGDYKALAEKMKLIYETDENMIEELKQKGVKRLEFFSWKRCAEQMITVFEETIKYKDNRCKECLGNF